MITIPFINNALSPSLSLSLCLDLALTDDRLRIRRKRRTGRGRKVTWLGMAWVGGLAWLGLASHAPRDRAALGIDAMNA